MIYQVRANLFFPTKSIAEEALAIVVAGMAKAVVVHPDEPQQQGSSVELIKCYHDETPTIPCVSCGTIHCP